ncbi:expressed unknown protein [Seminavis robusta]|uniref:Uncharacterized protein n=1 Tax=Seminavis robusta TaxID=568900 RepID=A0A9N8DI31_9STRA|nr:expressed unknown protein [Seminavis robusta]|eukprot:Sro101_g051540.1 n/a (482) ;mRNA; r:41194-42936
MILRSIPLLWRLIIGLLCLVLPQSLARAGNEETCFRSTFDIILKQLTDPKSEYIVCPDTTIEIGRPSSPDYDEYEGGDWPLMPLGPNVVIKCGESGESKNNCVLNSSFFHIASFRNLPKLGLLFINADYFLVSGFTLGGTGSPFHGVPPVSVSLAAPGELQVLHDMHWKHAHLGTALSVGEMPPVSPDQVLDDLSVYVTLRRSSFQSVTYTEDLISMKRQSLIVKKTIFADVAVANHYCQNCHSSLIVCQTNEGYPTTTNAHETRTNRHDAAYCTVKNNCFYDVEATQTLLLIQEHGYGSVVLDRQRNFVSGFYVVGDLPPLEVCHHGHGLLPHYNTAEFVSCVQLQDIHYCPVLEEGTHNSEDPYYTHFYEEPEPLEDYHVVHVEPSEHDHNDHGYWNTDTISRDEDDYFPSQPDLSTRTPPCSRSLPCGQCEGDCDHDSHCRGKLKCFQRQGSSKWDSVPGCSGSGKKAQDYCYDPNDA